MNEKITIGYGNEVSLFIEATLGDNGKSFILFCQET
jgi:hypothetical protein